jgi:two-component system response regulator
MKEKHFQILLVEDDPGDAQLTQIGLAKTATPLDLNIVDNGQAALDYLDQKDPYADVLRPDLILLDLNLPGLSGRDVLSTVKQDADFRAIPIIILSTSDRKEDISEAYALGANCYVRKHSDLKKFLKTIKQLENFWLTTVELYSKNPI